MTYVDGFVAPVPKDKIEAYREMSEMAGKVWREHGALAYVECIADDVPEGKTTDFYRAVKREPGETVAFAYAVYESREHRGAVHAKVMADPRLKEDMDPARMPFDTKRMFWGGFKPIVEL